MSLNIAWGITGCGDHLEETVTIMKELKERYGANVKAYLSVSGAVVVKWYKLWKDLNDNFTVRVEKTPNAPFLVGDLQLGKYDFLLICPSTSNTANKIAQGISDSLLTNAAAQAMKANVPVYIFPADLKPGEVVTTLPGGKKLTLTMRDIDIGYVGKLRKMPGLTVIESPGEIEGIVRGYHGKKPG